MARQCGDCQLCCKLLPVKELNKGAEPCRFQKVGKGCLIYNRPEMPISCRAWSCAWLVDEATANLSRPDRSHYVIDIMPDFIRITYDDAEPVEIPVVQVWCDPSYPAAHRDPALRSYLAQRGREGFAAVIRLNSRDGFTLFPPSMSADGQWHEVHSSQVMPESKFTDVLSVIEKSGAKL